MQLLSPPYTVTSRSCPILQVYPLTIIAIGNVSPIRMATHFPVAYETTPVPGQGFEIAPLIHSGNQATKDRGMMRGQFLGAGFSGTSMRINVRCSCAGHKGASAGWGGPQKGYEKTVAKNNKDWVPELRQHRARQGQHSPEIAPVMAPTSILWAYREVT